MEIIAATEEHVSQVYYLAEGKWADLFLPMGMSIRAVDFTRVAANLISQPNSICLVAVEVNDEGKEEVIGALGAVTIPYFFDQAKLASLTPFIMVREYSKGVGTELLKAYESWAEMMGVDYLFVASPKRLDNAKNMYLKRGYKEVETNFIKRLSD
jgi:GNAT superfamily N-acetyltransferase